MKKANQVFAKKTGKCTRSNITAFLFQDHYGKNNTELCLEHVSVTRDLILSKLRT